MHAGASVPDDRPRAPRRAGSRADGAGSGQDSPAGLNPRFWRLLLAEPLGGQAVLDVGTGAGRLALALAPRCARVVGIDADASAIAEARRRAEALGFDNARFVVADADAVAYDDAGLGLAPTMVTAHLFLSDPLLEHAAAALPGGGVLAFVGFHADQWRETGRRSRFAWDEARAAERLEACGFAVEHLEVDTDVTTYASVEEALAAVVGLQERWRQDGRWFRYIEYLERGGRSLTRSHLIAKARRRR